MAALKSLTLTPWKPWHQAWTRAGGSGAKSRGSVARNVDDRAMRW